MYLPNKLPLKSIALESKNKPLSPRGKEGGHALLPYLEFTKALLPSVELIPVLKEIPLYL